MSKAKSGGGINSNKVVHSRGVAAGTKAKGMAPCGTIGLQRVVTTAYKHPAVSNPISGTQGNAAATAAGQGPGAGRTVAPTGSQGRHGGKE